MYLFGLKHEMKAADSNKNYWVKNVRDLKMNRVF